MSALTLTFYGGAGSVTGSNFLLETKEGFRLLIDCGLKQGCLMCEDENRDPFPYDPKSIDVLLVTHAHIDHTGRIPYLVREGFAGIIYSTPPTKELAELMLVDSLGVLTKEATEEQKEPLYEEKDVKGALSLWKTAPYHTDIHLGAECTGRFLDAGHILGSAMIELRYKGKKVVFTGDLGNTPAPLARPTEDVTGVDYLIMESVYGDRTHESTELRSKLFEDIVKETIDQKGALLIPAFSVERTQTLLYELNKMVEASRVPSVPVFLDSPLAIKTTRIYKRYSEHFNQEVQADIKEGDDIFDFPGLAMTMTSNESRAISRTKNPKIIIAGSGMSNGGRILHHEKEYLSDKKSTLLLVGYQAPGSLGRELQDGARSVVINGTSVLVRARIKSILGYSAHKDSEGLMEFASRAIAPHGHVFAVMGEPKASLFLVQRLRDYYGIDAKAPSQGDSIELSA